MAMSFFSDLLQTISERGRSLLGGGEAAAGRGDLLRLCEALLTGRGEASGVAMAREVLAGWSSLDTNARRAFLVGLAEGFDADRAGLDKAVANYLAAPTPAHVAALHEAAEPRRQEVLRRLNLAPGGIATLVQMRECVLAEMDQNPALQALDADFVHLFSSWFNRGFLVLRRVDWATPANILEKIIQYEAVHEIHDWDDLRRRLAPTDRRLYAFFHPQLVDDPLIFVEVALTTEMPDAIAPLLADARTPIPAENATTAVFYSISNCQKGLRGISFGNFLIKQVVEELKRELPRLSTFVTLSPVPGFARWLDRERMSPDSLAVTAAEAETLSALDDAEWRHDLARCEAVRKAMLPAAAHYFLHAKTPSGRPIDPVARFHLGNGARLERLDFLGNTSPRGLKESHGLMVNYLYKLDDIEKNHEAFASKGEVVAAAAVRKLARDLPRREPQARAAGEPEAVTE